MVGTEDGQIHKCSCSYNEQYLNTYSAHTGPVNRVKWSPFVPNLFLSCSADWTVRLWHQDNESEVFKFQSGRDNVSDIAWSPHSSSCFATVSSDGRLEIWDLQFSTLDPAINHNVLDRQLTSVCFAKQSSTVVTGDDFGAVMLYKLGRAVHEEETPVSGVISPYLAKNAHDVETIRWRAEQAQTLQAILNTKKDMGAVAAPGTASTVESA